VIGQVRISPVVSIEKYIPDIQDRFRQIGFPRFKRGQLQELQFSPDTAPKFNIAPRFEFQDKAGSSGILVTSDFIALHTNLYRSYELFEDVLRTALEIVHEAVNISLVERLGLRYVDMIRLGPNELFTEYLRPGLHGFDAAVLQLSEVLQKFEVVGKTETGTLIVRYSQNKGGAFLPPDLALNTLNYNISLGQEETIALLDLDHYSERQVDFHVQAVMEAIGALHDGLDLAFRGTVTEAALSRWGKATNHA
jgi:uncharacterized protein (TIGR04255 family)